MISSQFFERIDLAQLTASNQLPSDHRTERGQFLTPSTVSRYIASLFGRAPEKISLLDPGAGLGSLTAAFVSEFANRSTKPRSLTVTAIESESAFLEPLSRTLDECDAIASAAGISFSYHLLNEDFVETASAWLQHQPTLFDPRAPAFTHAILNPPYRKISANSPTRMQLRRLGIETSNFYSAFLWLAIKLLTLNGELAAITPRSFCNGPFFKPFRRAFLDTMTIKRARVFDSRHAIFSDDDVLQENIIFYAIKARLPKSKVEIVTSSSMTDDLVKEQHVTQSELVDPADPEKFIHLVPDQRGKQIRQHVDNLSSSITDLQLNVSTGRVVDFRQKHLLRKMPSQYTLPLLYPQNIKRGMVEWPIASRKPQALANQSSAQSLILPSGYYVLVKRFTSKEEKRRVVAALLDPSQLSTSHVAFENHLNYYHSQGEPLSPLLAKGLVAYLNSTLVDEFFRQFSGHTQVNATDLRRIKYPTRNQLIALGRKINGAFPSQPELDLFVATELNLTSKNSQETNAMDAKQRIAEALDILRQLGVPRAQQNERSALTLLALMNLRPGHSWSDAVNPLVGIHEMLAFFNQHYGVKYAENSRETVRRQTIHQFVQVGIVLQNPDKPRAINSPHNRYQIANDFLALARTYSSTKWELALQAYREHSKELKRLHPSEREMPRMSVRLPDGTTLDLTAEGQNKLIKQIIEEFCTRFTPGAQIIYVGDAGTKFKLVDKAAFDALDISLDEHGKMPDVVVYHAAKNWLVLIEAVTSHGPIDIKRHNELKHLFRKSRASLVFLTAFESRKAMVKYMTELAWETDVWLADSPSHLVHFDGKQFLGPYSDSDDK